MFLGKVKPPGFWAAKLPQIRGSNGWVSNCGIFCLEYPGNEPYIDHLQCLNLHP